jgi:ketosteroid isomerase-like protein
MLRGAEDQLFFNKNRRDFKGDTERQGGWEKTSRYGESERQLDFDG